MNRFALDEKWKNGSVYSIADDIKVIIWAWENQTWQEYDEKTISAGGRRQYGSMETLLKSISSKLGTNDISWEYKINQSYGYLYLIGYFPSDEEGKPLPSNSAYNFETSVYVFVDKFGQQEFDDFDVRGLKAR